jgi:hypothetical protein
MAYLNYQTMRTVANLPAYLTFVSDSQDTASIRFDFGPQWEGFEYDSYFVRIADGEYTEIWGMCGIVPNISKLVTKLV